MAPVQVAILPIADRHNAYAHAIAEALQGFPSRDKAESEEEQLDFEPICAAPPKPLRVEVDERRESLGRKIRENQQQKVPYMLIVGDKDIEAGTVGVRSREDGDIGAMPLEQFLSSIQNDL
jgi:threonyl-tRNA synthetase